MRNRADGSGAAARIQDVLLQQASRAFWVRGLGVRIRPMARAASFVLLLCLGFGADRVLGGDVVINEVNYEPLDETLLEEFVEIYNAGGSSVDLSGWYFSEGIQYTFPQGASIAPGAY